MAECRSCHAPIRWALSVNGKPIPLNLPADAVKGTVQIVNDKAIVLSGEALERQRGQVPLYLAHFATCPTVSEHRR